MQISKSNVNVLNNESSSLYYNVNDTSNYISVTLLIDTFKQPYDKEFWSAYKALEKLLTKDLWNIEKKSLLNTKRFDKSILELYDISELDFNKELQLILDDWLNEKSLSIERGNKIHKEFENIFYKLLLNIKLDKFGIGGKFECRKDYTDLDIEFGIYPEYLMNYESDDKTIKITGLPDLIIKSGNEITIIDHKSNKKIDIKSGFNSLTKQTAKMKYPLNTLDDCNFIHYSLLLTAYAWILLKINPNFIIKDLIINHYDHNNKNTLYRCEYMKDEFEKLLRFYKKESILNKNRNARKPIIY